MLIKLKSGEGFECENSLILDGAIAAGFSIPFSCKRGECDTCECTLLEGKVDEHGEIKTSGAKIKTCEAKPLADCFISAEHLPELKGIKKQLVAAKVSQLQVINNVAIVRFRTPPSVNLNFVEGQYLDLLFAGMRRSYSIASVSSGSLIELHIKKVEGGAMSAKVFSEFTENTLVRFEGPLGSFFVRKSEKPLIFLATGTGFAPVQAMVERLIEQGSTRKVNVYWGNRERRDFYTELPALWSSTHDWLDYVPVVSRGQEASPIKHVQEAALNDVGSFDGFEIYACGSPNMISSAKELATRNGLPSSDFYSDAFVATTN